MEALTVLKLFWTFIAIFLTWTGVSQFRVISFYFESKVPANKTGLDYVLLDMLFICSTNILLIGPLQMTGFFLRPYLNCDMILVATVLRYTLGHVTVNVISGTSLVKYLFLTQPSTFLELSERKIRYTFRLSVLVTSTIGILIDNFGPIQLVSLGFRYLSYGTDLDCTCPIHSGLGMALSIKLLIGLSLFVKYKTKSMSTNEDQRTFRVMSVITVSTFVILFSVWLMLKIEIELMNFPIHIIFAYVYIIPGNLLPFMIICNQPKLKSFAFAKLPQKQSNRVYDLNV